MKKSITLIMVMLSAVGVALAQDIYSVGNFTNASGFQCAAVYRNDQKLYEKVPPLGDYDFDSPSLVVNGDDIYWAMNSVYAAGGYNYGDIYKNGNLYFNSPGGQNIHINDLTFGDGHLYAGGSKLVEGTGLVGDVSRATVWKDSNTEPLYILGEAGHSGSVAAIGYSGGYVISVGTESNGSGGSNGKVWLNGSQLHDFGSSVYPKDLALYDDEIYVLAKAYNNNPAGWVYRVYKGTQVLYTILGANVEGEAQSLCVDAGDVYVTGYADGAVKVWKNGSVFCSVSNSSSGASLASMANHRGIYHAGYVNGSAAIWHGHNDFPYVPANCNSINDIYVEDHCINNDIWTLPFADSFETDNTPWICWINVDTDHNNGEYLSYWHRCGSQVGQAATGEYFIRHEGHPTVNQTGWLVTPRLFLQPDRDYTTLSFKEMTGGSGFEANLSVRVSTNSDPNNADAYTQIWSSNSPNLTWQTRNIDLSEYQGKAIYIAFKFTGVNSWDWYIDDVAVTEEWSPCSVPATLPFMDSFDDEINYCWYNVDMDYSGDNKCWQYSESNHYAVHPFGPQGVPQEGWLFSRSVTLPSNGDYVLSFNSKSSQPNQGSAKRNSVWIALDETGVPDNFHYTKIWEQTSGFSSDWTEVSIPLSNCAGHNVRVAFVYEGDHGHNGAIDDVSIEETIVNSYTVNTAVNPTGAGSVSGGGTYPDGTSITLTAICNPGYSFSHWNDGNTANPRTVTVNQNITYTAYYDLDEYTIQVYAQPANGGTVTGGGNYHYGETATLTATPNSGFEFAGWSDGNQSNPRMVTVVAATYYVAVFNEVGTTYYTVGGYAVPEGAGEVTGTGTYEAGTTVVVGAEANPGYTFDAWDDGTSENPRIVTVNDDMTFIAYFSQNTYTITVNANPANGGTVTGGGIYSYGNVATLRATPSNGYVFVGWSDGSSENPHEVTVMGNATYTATFSQGGATYYTLSTFVSPSDAGNVTGSGTYLAGTSATLRAIAKAGYSFSHWNDGATQNPRDVTVNNNMSFTAYFNVNTYTITTNASPANGGTVTGGGTFAYGESVMLTATPNANYSFIRWSDGNASNPRAVTVTDNATYTAYFQSNTGVSYVLTLICNNDEGIVMGGGVYSAGESVTVQAYPKPGFAFDCWNDGNKDNPRTVTMNDDLILVAFFKGTGLNEEHQKELVIYPNPAKESIRIKGLDGESEVQIFNSLGTLVKAVTADADQEIGISELANGLYMMRCGNQSIRFLKY